MAWLFAVALWSTQAAQMPPAARWQLDTAVARCTLARQLDADTAVLIETTPGEYTYNVSLVGRQVHDRPNGSGHAIDLLLGNERIPGRYASFIVAGGTRAVRLMGLDEATMTKLAAAGSIGMVIGKRTVGPVALPSMANAWPALNRCVAMQLEDWGADPAQFQPGGTPARPIRSPDGWLSKEQLIRLPTKLTQLNAGMRLTIAPDGSISECRQETGTPEPKVEKFVCAALASRTLYTSARDASGRPVRGVGFFRVLRVSIRVGAPG